MDSGCGRHVAGCKENLSEADEADRLDLLHRATIHSDLGKHSVGKLTRVVFQNQSR